MMKQLYRLIISIILLTGPDVATGVDLDSNYVAKMRRGIALSLTEEFDSARALFEPLIEADSTDYSAFFFLAAVYHSEMMDAEDFVQQDTFQALLDAAYRHAGSAIERGDKPAWALFIQGSTHAYRAALETHIGSWFKAMKEAVKGKNRCLDALRIDPSLYDTYVVLGNYHYWKSARTEFINWLPLVADRKEQGIDELRLASDSSLVSGDLALNSLVWIHLQQNRPDEALACAERLHAKFPNSRLVNWALAFSNYDAGNLHQAVNYFGEIIESLERDSTQNYFNLIECRYHRGMIYSEMHDFDAAESEMVALTSYPVGEAVADRQRAKISDAKKWLRQYQDKIGKARSSGDDSKGQ